ncbi:MAG TPA: methyltransferase domain-containing protein [Methylomirabilota bacterium]|jgi:ubiquinone/menaquinone biosynthesis C-methylase UbiE
MAERDAAFVGTIPEHYDRHLGPLLFHDMADEMAARLDVPAGARVLETACGTGIVTRRLLGRLGAGGHLVATDLNAPMLAHAAARLPASDRLEWRQADATSLPFDDRSFDAVVCQFGWMFFPDKTAGARAAFRVLRPGARLLLSVWDRLEDNTVPRITHETVATFFSSSPPQFYTVPFVLHDPAVVERFLREAGFEDVRWQRVDRTGESPSAREAATGLIRGNPIYQDIMDRRPDALADIEAAIAARLAATLGDRPLRAALRAVFFSARRPAG